MYILWEPSSYVSYAEFTSGDIVIRIYQQEFVLDVTSEKT